MSVGTEPVC